MDPELYKYITPTTDGSGMKMENTYTRRFHTSKVKITSPQSQNVKVLQGCNEVDIIPTITSLPVNMGIQTVPNVRKISIKTVPGTTELHRSFFDIICRYSRDEIIQNNLQVCFLGNCKPMFDFYQYCNEVFIEPGVNNFAQDVFLKTPNKNEIITSVWTEIPPGLNCSSEVDCNLKTYGGYDYITVNVQPPVKQVVANVGILNGLAQEMYLNCQSCIYKKRDQDKPLNYPDCRDEWASIIKIHPEFENNTPEDICRTLWMDAYYLENGKEVPPPLLTTTCLFVKDDVCGNNANNKCDKQCGNDQICKNNCLNSEYAKCEEEFNRCNKFEHIDNCKVDRCWLPAGAVVDPNDPQWSEHFVDMCNNYSGTLETDRTERCERDAGGNFRIVYYNPANNVIYHHKRLDWNINKAFIYIDPAYLTDNGENDPSSIISSTGDRIKVSLGISNIIIQNGMAYIDSGTICSGADLITSVEGYMLTANIHFNIRPYLAVDADGMKRIKFDIPESGGDIGYLDLVDHSDTCDGLAKVYLEDYYFPRHTFRTTMKRMFLEGDRPLLQSAIFGLFGLTGAAAVIVNPDNPGNSVNPNNPDEYADIFNQVGYRNLDDMYISSIQLDSGSDTFLGLNYTKVNLITNYLWGLRPNY